MKKHHGNPEMLRTVVKLVVEIVILVFLLGLIAMALPKIGLADSETTEAYVLCADYVNIRPFPNRKGEALGRFETGDVLHLDGKKKNGYLHCVGTNLEADGWIFSGYVVYDRPERIDRDATIVSKGRLAARKYVGGKRTRWLKPLATVRVYSWSDEWCVTNCGYVQTKYLELEGV